MVSGLNIQENRGLAMLKKLLDKAGLSQTDLANLLGITPKAVNAWANGHQVTPKWATEYLRLYIGIRNLIKEKL